MPNIKTYDTPALSLRPSENGVEATAGAARRVGSFFNQQAGATDELARNTESLGQFKGNLITQTGARAGSALAAAGDAYVKYEDNKEISHGSAMGTAGVAGLSKTLNDTVAHADPNDGSVAAKFMEAQFEPWADNFKAQFTTENSQKFAEGFVDRYRQHFQTNAAADMATMGAIAAKQNAEALKNNLSSMVYLDPSSLDTNIDILKHSAGHIVDSSPTIDAETGAKVKAELNQKGIESLVKSAVSGMIEKNPSVDLDAIQKKYADYINGGELKMFQKAAETQAKVNAYHDKSAALAQKQLDDLNVHQSATKTMSDNVDIDPTSGRPIIKPQFFKDALDIARNNPNAPSAAATVRTMLDWGQSQLNKEAKVSDATVKSDLTDRMFDPNSPTSQLDLMKAQAAGKLSDHDFNTMNRMVTELQQTPLKGDIWKATTTAVKAKLIDPLAINDTVGKSNYAAFMSDFIPKYIAQSRAGTLPPNALDTRDPKSLISQSMTPYKGSMQGNLSASPAAAPAEEKPPMDGAQKAKDGNWYVQKDGKYFRVDK